MRLKLRLRLGLGMELWVRAISRARANDVAKTRVNVYLWVRLGAPWFGLEQVCGLVLWLRLELRLWLRLGLGLA